FRAFLCLPQSPLPSSLLVEVMENANDIMSCSDLMKLKTIRFIAKAVATNCASKVDESDLLILRDRNELCEEMILKLHSQTLLAQYGKKSAMAHLNDHQLTSLQHMRAWSCLGKNAPPTEPTRYEICPVCRAIIPFEGRLTGTCVN